MSAGAPFSRGGVAALVAGGFALFLALLFLIGRGESPLADSQNGEAHALAKGLNGYAGLAALLAAEGYEVRRSRSPSGLETPGILVLTPGFASDAAELGSLLEARRTLGPTLVILPKWIASGPPENIPEDAAAKFKRGWVVLADAGAAGWTADLPPPFTLAQNVAHPATGPLPRWRGLGQAGTLPTRARTSVEPDAGHVVLIADEAGGALALLAGTEPIGDDDSRNFPVLFLAEPDLANNYGLADPARAAAALALVRELDDDDFGTITFDLTLNGFGGSENLLTLAFRPPFLAATLCLILALALVFWRALMRFGPAASAAPSAAAFGKRQLVTNGAGLILRARRWGLLAHPYAALAERRLARALGLARSEPQAIDRALARRLPGEEPFTARAARLEAARSPADILSAARSLDTIARKLDP